MADSAWVRLAGVLLLIGCSDSSPEKEEPGDPSRASTIPDACTLSLESHDAARTLPESAGGTGGLGGAAALGGASSGGSGPEDGGLVRQLVRLTCPSYVSHLAVARGSQGELDVVVAQRGTNSIDENAAAHSDLRAHLHLFRFTEQGVDGKSLDPVEDGTFLSVALVPGNTSQDTALLQHIDTESENSRLLVDPIDPNSPQAELPSPGRDGTRSRTLRAASGPALYYQESPDTPFVLHGLTDSPEVLHLPDDVSHMALSMGDDGTLHALTHDDTALRVLSGSSLSEETWSREIQVGELDLIQEPSKEGRKIALAGSRLLILEGSEATPTATIPNHSESECDDWELNFGCDHCPVGTPCEDRVETNRGLRLFTLAGHPAVAVLSREMVKERVTDTDESPFGVCVCDTTLIETEPVADYLSVYQVRFRGIDQSPELVPLMRQVIGDGEGAQSFGFAVDAKGELDVWYGNEFLHPYQNFNSFPPPGTEYLIQHLGTRDEFR